MNAVPATLLGAVLAPWLLGAGIVRALGLSPSTGLRAFVAWAYLVGQFAASWGTIAWLSAAPSVPGWLLPAACAVIGCLLLSLGRARTSIVQPSLPLQRSRAMQWATGLVVILVLERCSIINVTAILGGDEANIWSAKAAMMRLPGGLGVWAASGYGQALDYPLLDPLVQSLAMTTAEKRLLWENRLPFHGFAVALLLMLSDALQRRAPSWLAVPVFAAFATSTFLVMAPTVYADVLLAFALLAVVVSCDDVLRGDRTPSLPLGCIAAAALVATKNEGAMLLASVCFGLVAVRIVDRQRSTSRLPLMCWSWVVIPILTYLGCRWFNLAHGFANDIVSPDPGDGRTFLARVLHWWPARIGPVLEKAWRMLIDGASTRGLLIALVAAMLVVGRRWRAREFLLPTIVVVVATCGYAIVYLGVTASHVGPRPEIGKLMWHMDVSADRLCLHLLPVVAVAIVAACRVASRREVGPSG